MEPCLHLCRDLVHADYQVPEHLRHEWDCTPRQTHCHGYLRYAPPRQTKTPDAQYLIMSGKKAINALVMDPVLAVDSHGKNYL